MSAQIDSILQEQRLFPPPESFVRQATIAGMEQYKALVAEAERDHAGFWARLAREHLRWQEPFTQALDESNAPFYRWFADGKLNVSYNCLDRHLGTPVENKAAILFEADDGKVTKVTYRELYERVCRMANAIKSLGYRKGDRAIIYLPMSIEGVVAMQACARLGVIHSVVFGGFSAKSLQERIVDVGATLVITADEQVRGGKKVPLKAAVDEAFAMGGCDSVRKVIVYQRTGEGAAMKPGRDLTWGEAIDGQSADCPPEWVEADHPLFVLYTADIGWVTGHTYIVYGPTACGATQVVFEGIPTFPNPGRFWEMIDRHKVSVFYTAPTAIRALVRAGQTSPDHHPRKYDLSSLRLLGSVGEPINPEAWMWYYENVGRGHCPIVDTWWQTETGATMISPLPGVHALKPGSCTMPLPGISASVIDEAGENVPPGKGGFLAITKPWPSMIRTIWGDPERFKKTYFPAEIHGGRYYVAGDGATIEEDGYFRVMGRIDDVLNVSGHRLGTMEIESALVAHPMVAEAAVVGRPDDLTGEAISAFVVLKQSRPTGSEAHKVAKELREWVGKEIGPIAKPKEIRFGENLPKTRSGKIMRRLLRSLARGEAITQDVSTLENPAILDQLKETS